MDGQHILNAQFPKPALGASDSSWSDSDQEDDVAYMAKVVCCWPPHVLLATACLTTITNLLIQVPSYATVMEHIDHAIQQLGGTVAPRVNWSSPHDATWMMTSGTLACTNAQEVCDGVGICNTSVCTTNHNQQVILLLHSSDRVAHDITTLRALNTAGDTTTHHAPQPTLALRKWQRFRPEREFRCFVCNKRLVGMCGIGIFYTHGS